MNFEVLWVFPKAFSAKVEDVAFISSTSEQSAKVFSAKIVFSTNSQKFSCSMEINDQLRTHYGRTAQKVFTTSPLC